MTAKKAYLNLGCGVTFHEAFTNVDFVSTSKQVLACNLLKGIPFPDNSFEVVYHSHILEHFSREDAGIFLKECHRVLVPSGLIRIVVPDLEQIACNYVKFLSDALRGVEGAGDKYEWTMLELYDQVVRTKIGGRMIDYIQDPSKNNDAFLLQRNGKEVQRLIDSLRNSKNESHDLPVNEQPSGWKRIKASVKYRILKKLLKDDMKALEIGRFRLGGEIHQWMYDRYSLRLLLEQLNFHSVEQKTATESAVKDWAQFELDYLQERFANLIRYLWKQENEFETEFLYAF